MTRDDYLDVCIPLFEEAYSAGKRGTPMVLDVVGESFPAEFERFAGYAPDENMLAIANEIYRVMGLMYEKGQQDAGKEAQA